MGLQSSTGADKVDETYDDAVAVTPSDTIDDAHRLRGVRALVADVGGTLKVITNKAAATADTQGGAAGFGIVTSIAITAGGSGYTGPTAAFAGGGGTGAAGTVTMSAGVVTGVVITNPGIGYTSAPTVTINDADGTLATAAATVSAGPVSFTVPSGVPLKLDVAYVLAASTATGIKALF